MLAIPTNPLPSYHLTASDFQDRDSIASLNGMSQRLAELKVGQLMLCVYCSQEDMAAMMWLLKEYLPHGLVWIASNDFSENR